MHKATESRLLENQYLSTLKTHTHISLLRHVLRRVGPINIPPPAPTYETVSCRRVAAGAEKSTAVVENRGSSRGGDDSTADATSSRTSSTVDRHRRTPFYRGTQECVRCASRSRPKRAVVVVVVVLFSFAFCVL